jgi:hypothetical protein
VPTAGAPAWLDDLDLHAGPPEASMGTRALHDDRWLSIDDDWSPERVDARRLLRDRRGDVLASAPAGRVRDAALELGSRIDAWLAARHPDLADDAHLGEGDAMAAARARVAEDVCVLTPDAGGGWVLAAGAVCFPSYWRLHEKVGRPLPAVHAPVPGYAGPLSARVDTFLGRLRPGQGVWRRNWSIHDNADRFAPVRRAVDPTSRRWLRSEYQTLVRLEETDTVAFTIRTQQVAVEQLAARPDVCAALAAALRAWTPAQRRYKGAAVDGALLRSLDAFAAR